MDSAALLAHFDVSVLRNRLYDLRDNGGARQLNPTANDSGTHINVVLQGGGTLGIAHVGVIYALELLKVRIAGVAGTSAGAIAALLICAARSGKPGQPYSLDILEVLSSMPADEFIDGPYLIRRMIKELLLNRAIDVPELAIPANSAVRRLSRKGGLNHGTQLLEWLQTTLAKRFGVITINDLLRRLDAAVDGAHEACSESTGGLPKPDPINCLQMIATGLRHGLKAVFPRAWDLFDLDAGKTSPAIFARASMSIPIFFEQFRLRTRADRWKQHVEFDLENMYDENDIEELAGLDELRFVDGGVLSNFPIDAFRAPDGRVENWLQALPTIGFSMFSSSKKIRDEGTFEPTGIKSIVELGVELFSATRALRDREARLLCKLPSGIAFIDTHEHNWLNFMLDEPSTRDLFIRGMRCVAELVEQRMRTEA